MDQEMTTTKRRIRYIRSINGRPVMGCSDCAIEIAAPVRGLYGNTTNRSRMASVVGGYKVHKCERHPKVVR